MSRIKDLYAEQEGIEDLMPVEEHEDFLVRLADKIFKTMTVEHTLKHIKEDMQKHATFSGDDGDITCDNLSQLCETAVDDYVQAELEEQCIDISDYDFALLCGVLAIKLEDTLEEFASDLAKEYIEDIKENQYLREDMYK